MEEKKEEKKEQTKQEIPKGYYLAQVPTEFQNVIAIGEKEVPAQELLIQIANALLEAGILKE